MTSSQGSWVPYMAEAYWLGLMDGQAAAQAGRHYEQDRAAAQRQREGHTALKWLGCYIQGYRHGWASKLEERGGRP